MTGIRNQAFTINCESSTTKLPRCIFTLCDQTVTYGSIYSPSRPGLIFSPGQDFQWVISLPHALV